MPHHYGRSGTSMGKAQRGTQSHHGLSQGTPVSSGATYRQKKAVQIAIDKKGADNLSNYKLPKVNFPGSFILNATLPLRQKSFEKNRKFFREKVLTSKNKGKYKNTLESYQTYMQSRGSGEIDAYGNTLGGGDGQDRSVIKKVVGGQTLLAQAPTEAEVSQSDATNAAETKLTKRRANKRGRTMNIYTSSSGKAKDKLVLGKKSLLGMV